MAGTLGGLIVTLGLDAVEFTTGLTKSEQVARNWARKIDKEIARGAKLAAAGFTILEGAVIAAGIAVDRLVKQAAEFQDLEERTGASAQALASFSIAAQVAGATSADVADAMNKMAKNLTGVDDESKAAGAALDALHIPIKEFKNLKPEDQIKLLATTFEKFADSPEKAAVAMALLGKSGAKLLPFFKELASGASNVNLLTDAQIKLADEYADAQKREIATLQQYLQVLAIEAVPAITDVVKLAKEFIKALTGINDAATEAQQNAALKTFAQDVASALRDAAGFALKLAGAVNVVIATINVLNKTANAPKAKPFGSLGFTKEQADKANKELDDAQEYQERAMRALLDLSKQADQLSLGPPGIERGVLFSDRAYAAAQARAKNRPKLKFEGAEKADAGKVAKAQFDAALKEQERFIKNEQDMLKDREHYLQADYEDNLLGFRDYYAQRLEIMTAAQAKIKAALQEEIKLAETRVATPGLKEEEQIAAAEKLAALKDKLAETERTDAQARFDLGRSGTRAMRDYEDAVKEVDAQMKELVGDTAAAAAIRFDQQTRDMRAKAALEGDAATIAKIKALGEQKQRQEELNTATQKYSLITQQLGIEQGKVDLLLKSGAVTSLDAINQRSALALKYVSVLEAQAEAAAKAAAEMTPGPAQEQALLNVQRMRLEIDQLRASADELENTFRDLFVNTLGDALADVITGTKSFSDAIKDMEKQIIRSISNIAAHNIAEAIFGKSGPAGSVPGFFASLFGSTGAAGGGGNFLADLFGATPPMFASGGYAAANQPAIVGERGPELFVPRNAGNVIPNEVLMAKRAQQNNNINISVNVDGGTSRATADQIAVRTGLAVRRALLRNS